MFIGQIDLQAFIEKLKTKMFKSTNFSITGIHPNFSKTLYSSRPNTKFHLTEILIFKHFRFQPFQTNLCNKKLFT